MRCFKKYYLLLVLMLSAQVCFGQIKTISLDKASLPKSINFKGNIVNGVQWDDVDGRHIVLTTETGEIQSPTIDYDDGYRDAALYAYHYFLKGDSVVQTWKIYDFVKECPVDIRAN